MKKYFLLGFWLIALGLGSFLSRYLIKYGITLVLLLAMAVLLTHTLNINFIKKTKVKYNKELIPVIIATMLLFVFIGTQFKIPFEIYVIIVGIVLLVQGIKK